MSKSRTSADKGTHPSTRITPRLSLEDDLTACFTEELMKKPDVKCWGCGKKEQKGGPKFRQCPKCVQLKIVPSLFCSDECFQNNWSRHRKELHRAVTKNQLEQQKDPEEQEIEKKAEELRIAAERRRNEDNDDDDPYMRLLREGMNYQSENDWINAQKKYRKAQKLKPKLPQAYTHLGWAYVVSGQTEEGLKFMEAAVERWALTCLTGVYGEKWIRRTDMNIDIPYGPFARCVYELAEIFMRHKDGAPPSYNKPAWYCNDFVFKRIIDVLREYHKAMVNKKDDGKGWQYVINDDNLHLQNLDLWQAHVQYGALHNGMLNNEGVREALKDRTAKDLREAAKCYKKYSANVLLMSKREKCDWEFGPEFSSSAARKFADVLVERAKTWEVTPRNSAPFYEGCFILVFGLTSHIGKTRMNKKLGVVKTPRSEDGRYGVQIDGLDEPKSIHSRNLMMLPLPDKIVALVSCIAPAAQWKYLRPIAEEYAARLPDPE